jgi:hypothetical protein
VADSVELSTAVRGGLEQLPEDIIGADLPVFLSPERAAYLVFKLREVPDSEDVFPRGKWATIQDIESKVTACAKATVREAVRGA